MVNDAGDRPALDTDAKGEGAHLRIFYVSRKRPTTIGHGAGIANDSRVACLQEASHDASHRCLRRDCILRDCGRWRYAAGAQAPGADNSAIYLDTGADREQRLIAKARAEGTLTLYTSIATSELAPLAQAFEAKYGVKVQLWRALSENVVQRALTEARGGRRGMDAVETNAPEVEALAREDVVAQFNSPYLADLPSWAIPPHRRWFADRANLWVVGYNTEKVKREELPVELEGFADPRWKARLSLEATDSDWMYGLIVFMGEERGLALLRKLAALKPEMRKDTSWWPSWWRPENCRCA